ncbi:hypothetical protein INS49_004808 [Diaporthe citri]|uniref:uncharacterized protein n=1 Tax=Diaporthe citri TaxID=83186 RepID=UPI001C7EBE40|nr:uncharacterized protein INS49_004808 [Diaporthe citri]KAG6354204.1 hypothetical protein INS49_004808 [Diaporthe citri]
MATTSTAVEDHKSGDLELLSSGNFSDVEVVCGNRSWKCHGAILVPRCLWFRKALMGHFEEANTRQVTLVEEDPICVDLVLKYLYGRGLDIMRSVSAEHFVEHCVSLWHTADFLMLEALKRSVERAVRDYCDKRMKELCISPHRPTWRHPQHLDQLSPWALDLVEALRQAYEWQISDLKSVLMEFIWVARTLTLQSGIASVLFDHLKDTPRFADDFLGRYVSKSWLRNSVWVPPRDK